MYYGTFYLSGTIQLEKESKDLDVTCVLCSVPLIASLGIRWVMKYPQSSPQLSWSLCALIVVIQILLLISERKSFENSTCVFPMFWCIRKSEATTKLENGTEAFDNLTGCGAV